MYPYPSLQEAAPSIAYLGGLIRNPMSWDNQKGMQHLWAAGGFLASSTIGTGEAVTAHGSHNQGVVALPLTAEEIANTTNADLANHCDALVALANGGSVTLAAGRSGLLLRLVQTLITKAIESGAAEALIQKLIEQFLGGLTPTPKV